MIRLDCAMLCTAADLQPNGLLFVLGGWINHVWDAQLPVRRVLTVVARIEGEHSDFSEAHTFRVTVDNEDGLESVARVEGATTPSPPDLAVDTELPAGANIVIPLPLEFRRVGTYVFRLAVDGDELWAKRLKVTTIHPQL